MFTYSLKLFALIELVFVSLFFASLFDLKALSIYVISK